MTNRIRPPEWEALSAFLDNQISSKDRARLEARLKQEPELRQALEELRRTRLVLRSQRPLRAPRNFTLTPAMAGVRRGGKPAYAGPYNILRLASALATIFFILISVGDFAAQRFGPEPRTVSMAEQQDPVMGMGGGGGGGGPAIVPLSVATEAAVAESAAEPEAGPEASAETADAMTLMVTPVDSAQATPQTFKEGVDPAADMPVANAQQPGREAGGMYDAENTLPPFASMLIRGLQVALVLLAVVTAGAALYFRRNSG